MSSVKRLTCYCKTVRPWASLPFSGFRQAAKRKRLWKIILLLARHAELWEWGALPEFRAASSHPSLFSLILFDSRYGLRHKGATVCFIVHSARWCMQHTRAWSHRNLFSAFSKYRFQTRWKPDQRSSSWIRRCLQWAPAACSSKARQTRRVSQATDLLPGCWRGRDVGVREGSFLAVYRLWTWSEQCHGPVEQTWGMRM